MKTLMKLAVFPLSAAAIVACSESPTGTSGRPSMSESEIALLPPLPVPLPNLTCGPLQATIVVGVPNGSGYNIVGTPLADVIAGSDGNNVITGLGGNDIICGHGGDDRIFAANGNDRIFGGDGNDFIEGGLGNDHIEGGNGDDRLQGNKGNDYLQGGLGRDDLNGGPDTDRCKDKDGATYSNCETIG